jgi:hypothetical protein
MRMRDDRPPVVRWAVFLLWVLAGIALLRLAVGG